MLPKSMFAMTVDPCGHRLLAGFRPAPTATGRDLVVRVLACGVCRTDRHITDRDLPPRLAGGVPGHEVVGQIVARGPQVSRFALSLSVAWAGSSDEAPPRLLDAALIFAPVGALVPAALAATRKGGTVVCAGIHMRTVPAFDYRLLWGERVLKSVANLTREDGDAFFSLLEDVALQTHVQVFALQAANAAAQALRDSTVNGAAVLVP